MTTIYASETQLTPTMITPNQGHALESSGQADRCVDESSNHERDMTSAQDNVQDEYSSGSNILRKNHTETPCEGKCSLGEPEKALVDNCMEDCCSHKEQTFKELRRSACGPIADETEVEGSCQDSCCSNDDEKANDIDCNDACCSGQTEKSDTLDRDDCCSGSVNDTHKYGTGSACCKYKPVPCCDGKKRIVHPIVSCLDCSQFRALTALQFESAEMIVATRLLVVDLKPAVPLV